MRQCISGLILSHRLPLHQALLVGTDLLVSSLHIWRLYSILNLQCDIESCQLVPNRRLQQLQEGEQLQQLEGPHQASCNGDSHLMSSMNVLYRSLLCPRSCCCSLRGTLKTQSTISRHSAAEQSVFSVQGWGRSATYQPAGVRRRRCRTCTAKTCARPAPVQLPPLGCSAAAAVPRYRPLVLSDGPAYICATNQQGKKSFEAAAQGRAMS